MHLKKKKERKKATQSTISYKKLRSSKTASNQAIKAANIVKEWEEILDWDSPAMQN